MAKLDHSVGALGRLKTRGDELDRELAELFVELDATLRELEAQGIIVGAVDLGPRVGAARATHLAVELEARLESSAPIADAEVFTIPVLADPAMPKGTVDLRTLGGEPYRVNPFRVGDES